MRIPKFIQVCKISGRHCFVQVSAIDSIEPNKMQDSDKCVIYVNGRKMDLNDKYLDVVNMASRFAMLETEQPRVKFRQKAEKNDS